MDLPANPFKHAIKAGRQQIGLWSSLSSHLTVEILAGSGYDWLLLDTEHSPNELPMVHSQLQAATGGTAHPIVRPPWNDTVMIKRFLDIGTQTLLIPVRADRGGSAKGRRRHAVSAEGSPRLRVGIARVAFRSREEYFKRYEEELCVLVQVETRLSLDNLEAIANVEGVDGVFIGPGDLSAGLGHLNDAAHPEVQGAIADAIKRIKACGKAAGILTPDEKQARRYIELGTVFTAVGSDLGLLARGSEALLARFKS
jgi:4-hydroxy-2-oxoheptanedioate aldolase